MSIFSRVSGCFRIVLMPVILLIAAIACDLERNYGQLPVGNPFYFDAIVGDQQTWQVQVTPNQMYEVRLALANENVSVRNYEVSFEIRGEIQPCTQCRDSIMAW